MSWRAAWIGGAFALGIAAGRLPVLAQESPVLQDFLAPLAPSDPPAGAPDGAPDGAQMPTPPDVQVPFGREDLVPGPDPDDAGAPADDPDRGRRAAGDAVAGGEVGGILLDAAFAEALGEPGIMGRVLASLGEREISPDQAGAFADLFESFGVAPEGVAALRDASRAAQETAVRDLDADVRRFLDGWKAEIEARMTVEVISSDRGQQSWNRLLQGLALIAW